jgi:neutral ceramidase
MNGNLQAGFGVREITPPLGVALCGYGFYLERRMTDVLDPLYARCLLLDDGKVRVALVSCDLIGFAIAEADAIRRAIAETCGTGVERVMLACTHTHSGPATIALTGLGEPDPGYLARLPALIVEACRDAAADLAPAEAGWAIGAVEPIGFCRLDEEPADYTDPPLGLLLCRRAKGDIGLVHYACHAVTLGVNAQCSADYPGALVRAMRQHGVEALFANGPSGDIDPLVNAVAWGSGTPDDVERYGLQLADRAMELARGLECSSSHRLSAREARVELPVRVPSLDEANGALAGARERFARTNAPRDRFELAWCERALRVLREERSPGTVQFVVQLVQVGALRLVGLSGEVYSSVGRAAARAAGEPAMVAATTNGVTGYVPDEAALAAHKDYGSNTAAKIYGHFPLQPQAPRLIVEAVAALTH